MTTAKLWRTLRTAWWWLAIGAVSGVLVGAVALFLLPHTYESSARVLLVAQPSADTSSSMDSLTYVSLRIPTYVELAESDAALEAIAATTGLAPEEANANITFTVPDERPVIEVIAEGDSPESAQQLAAASADEIVHQVSRAPGRGLPVTATVVTEAEPGEQTFPVPSVLLPIGVITGVLAAFLLALVLSGRDRRPRLLVELAEAAGAPVFGVLSAQNSALVTEAEEAGEPTSAVGMLRRLDASGGRRFLAIPVGNVDTAILAEEITAARIDITGPAAVKVALGEVGADDLARLPADQSLILVAGTSVTLGRIARAAHQARSHGARIAGVALAAERG